MAIYIKLGLWVIFVFCEVLYGEECSFNSDNAYCCAGFYRNATSGRCDECPIGYYGMHCSIKCYGGYYGKGCLDMCKCTGKQICHHVYGCVDMTTTDQFTTTELDPSSTPTGKVSETTALPVNNTSDPNLQFTDTWIEDRGKHGITLRSALLYGIPSALSFIFVAIAVILIVRKITCTCTIKWKVNYREDAIGTVNMNDGYDMIDESLFGVQPSSGTQQQFSRNVEGSSTDDNSARNSSDYFHPMAENDQPLPYKYDYVDVVPVPLSANDPKSNGSDDSEHRKGIDCLDPISKMDSSSTSGSDISDANVVPIPNNDEYLHPYNTLDPDWRYKTHEYSGFKEQNDGYVNHQQTTLEQGIQTKHNMGQSSMFGKRKHVFETRDKPINRGEAENLNEGETKDTDNTTTEYKNTSQTVCNESKLPDKETNDYDDVIYIF